MPQMLRQDNIPRMLVASTTTATLATTSGGQSTLITVGGQQYSPASLLTLNAATVGANGLDAGSLGANQLWYVYAIAHQTSFAMALVASLSATPTMPTGYGTAYKLIGAFNTNASSQISFTVTPEDGAIYPVSAGFVLGRTDGLAAPAGYIGQVISGDVITGEQTTGSPVQGTYYDVVASHQITLTAGVWKLSALVAGMYGDGTGTGYRSLRCAIRTSGNVVVIERAVALMGPTPSYVFAGTHLEDVVTLSASTTYKLSYRFASFTGSLTPSTIGIFGDTGLTKLLAVRIA